MSPSTATERDRLLPNDVTGPHSSLSDDLENITTSPSSLSKFKSIAVIISVACSTLLSAIVNGIFTVDIPSIAKDVNLSQELLLWPQSVVSLVSACTLLLSGSVSDIIGSKPVYLAGSILQSAFILGAGLAQTGPQILVFRGLMGLAQSLCLTSSVSLITTSFLPGRQRNVAFACMGGGQPIGFSIGLLLAGILSETVGWRFGMHFVAGINFAVVVLAVFGIKGGKTVSSRDTWVGLKRDVDWFGILLASFSLGMLSYVLAWVSLPILPAKCTIGLLNFFWTKSSITANPSNLNSPSHISMLCISILLVPAFIFWMHRQVRRGMPALIPNSLWRSRAFSSICLAVFLTWAYFNSLEQLLSLWLQVVQQNSPLQTSIQFLPETVVGIFINAAVGLFVNRFSAFWIIVISTAISLPASLLMGLSATDSNYWVAAFPAICLIVVGPDSLYTIANLLISSLFPEDAQGLTGGVFNTMAQVGKSVGLALTAVISNAMTGKRHEENLVDGYRGGMWFCLALNAAALCVSFWGLRQVGKFV